MIPYKSGPYLVGNRFLLDLRTGKVSFHCQKTMRLLAHQLPPDPAQQPAAAELAPVAADPQPLTEAQRLAVWLPYMQAALDKPAPVRGCARSQDDPFWGTSAARADHAPAAAQDLEPWQELGGCPDKPARQWVESDEALYQEANMWACAVYHWTEGNQP